MEPKAQCKVCFVVLGRRHRLLHVRALLAKRNGGEQEICQVHPGSPLDSQLLHQERATPRAPLREEARGSRVLHREFAQEEMQEERFLRIHDRFIRDERFRKNMIELGRSEEICREVDKLANDDHTHRMTEDEIRVSSKQLVGPFEHSWFRHDARKASS